MKKKCILYIIIAAIILILSVSCSEFNAVKAPSVTITADTSADMCKINLSAGRYGIIKYTTDGTAPIATSPTYSEDISLPVGTTLRTASFCPGGRRSEIITTTIEMPPDASSVIIKNGEYCTTTSDSE